MPTPCGARFMHRPTALTGLVPSCARAEDRVSRLGHDGRVGLQFDLVGYAPVSPRSWIHQVPAGRGAAERAVEELVGSGWTYRGVRGPEALAGDRDLVGISVFGPVILVMWSGRPDTALRWDRLTHDPGCHRFHVGTYPASNGFEAHWTDPAGITLRRFSVSGGSIVDDIGEARVFDADAGTDSSLTVNLGRLPKKVVDALLDQADPEDIEVYDGRRYVRTSDRGVLRAAKIVRRVAGSNRWVAVDQTGPVNTLRDPLARPVNVKNVDRLAGRLTEAWFDLDPLRNGKLPPLHVYTWPDDPAYASLAEALAEIRADQRSFFALVADSNWDTVADRVAERYRLDLTDAYRLLDQPLLSLLRSDGLGRG